MLASIPNPGSGWVPESKASKILAAQQGPNSVRHDIVVEKKNCGKLIGPSGSTFKELRAKCGCGIFIMDTETPPGLSDDQRMVICIGGQTQVSIAVAEIAQILAGGGVTPSLGPSSFATPAAVSPAMEFASMQSLQYDPNGPIQRLVGDWPTPAHMTGKKIATASSVPGALRHDMLLDKRVIGKIIGPKGATYQKLQDQTGCCIYIMDKEPPPGSPPDLRLVCFIGAEPNIRAGISEVMACIAGLPGAPQVGASNGIAASPNAPVCYSLDYTGVDLSGYAPSSYPPIAGQPPWAAPQMVAIPGLPPAATLSTFPGMPPATTTIGLGVPGLPPATMPVMPQTATMGYLPVPSIPSFMPPAAPPPSEVKVAVPNPEMFSAPVPADIVFYRRAQDWPSPPDREGVRIKSAEAAPGNVRLDIMMKKIDVGSLIGTSGAQHKILTQSTGAKIFIMDKEAPPGEAPDMRLVVVVGQPQQVYNAQQAIMQIEGKNKERRVNAPEGERRGTKRGASGELLPNAFAPPNFAPPALTPPAGEPLPTTCFATPNFAPPLPTMPNI